MMLYLILLYALGVLIRTSNAHHIQSPCPSLFRYEPEGVVGDRWYGNIRIVTDSDYTGLWIHLVFDRLFPELGSDYGEVIKRDGTDWLIRRPKNPVAEGTTLNVRFFVRFDPSGEPPKLEGFRLNGRTICPNDGVILTTAAPQVELISPCPTVFQYEPPGPTPNRWYGIVNLIHKKELNGVWLTIRLDRAAVQLGNWFGEVKTDDNKEYLIRSSNHRLPLGEIEQVRFFIEYNPAEPVPKLSDIILNAEEICLANGNTGSAQIQRPAPAESTGPLGRVNLPPTTKRPAPSKHIFGSDFDPNSRPSFLQRINNQNEPNNNPQCGIVNRKARPLINYGTAAVDGEWPWHAALYHPKDTHLKYICGASLISLNHVLTAAHCVTEQQQNIPIQNEDLQVFLGKYHLRKFSNQGIQSFQVRKIVVHPDYNFRTFENDIAVIHLDRSAEFTDWVRPVCLWGDDVDLSAVVNREGTVVGWGFDETGNLTDHLMKANMPVVSHLTCIRSFTEFFGKFARHNTFCAGFRNGTSVCNGDSGGGLVFLKNYPISNQPVWQIRGLVSLSVALQSAFICDTSHYVIFTDVAMYLDWIKKAMNS